SVDQFLKIEAGDRYLDVAADPAARGLCEAMLAAMARGTRCAGFENDFAVFVGEEVLGEDRPLRTPTLVVHAVKDPMAPVDHVDWLFAHAPHCERVSVHAAGHLVWAGPEARVMHEARVRFLRAHAGRAA